MINGDLSDVGAKIGTSLALGTIFAEDLGGSASRYRKSLATSGVGRRSSRLCHGATYRGGALGRGGVGFDEATPENRRVEVNSFRLNREPEQPSLYTARQEAHP